MENVNQATTTTTTTAGTSTTTTLFSKDNPPYPQNKEAPGPVRTPQPQARPENSAAPIDAEKKTESFGEHVDMTSIVRGKKINPKTGTQTSEDDPDGVWADNVHNEIQIEHAGHTQTQRTPGAGEMLADTIEKTSGNDGNKTAVQSKPTTAHGTQNDAQRARSTGSEEVVEDHKIQQGETGAESRPDLQDQGGGASGTNVQSNP